MAEWQRQAKTVGIGEKRVPVLLCPPQTPHGLTQARTRTSTVKSRGLTAWATGRPLLIFWCLWCLRTIDRLNKMHTNRHKITNSRTTYVIFITCDTGGIVRHVTGCALLNLSYSWIWLCLRHGLSATGDQCVGCRFLALAAQLTNILKAFCTSGHPGAEKGNSISDGTDFVKIWLD
jgi:hypothetical protein